MMLRAFAVAHLGAVAFGCTIAGRTGGSTVTSYLATVAPTAHL